MGTVIKYLENYGKYTFQEMPMTEVDSLALCQLSYLKFDGILILRSFSGISAMRRKTELCSQACFRGSGSGI